MGSFPIDGRQSLSRTGTWICHLTSPVDLAPSDRRTFHLQFDQIATDRRWNGPAVRALELRTSAFSFATDPGYAPWLLLVVDGFLDSDEVDGVREAFEVERGPQS
jgi:hypothetical protein